MNYVDYREALGLGFEDSEKLELLRNKLLYYLDKLVEPNIRFYDSDFDAFFLTIGVNPVGYNVLDDIGTILLKCKRMEELVLIFVLFSNTTEASFNDYNLYQDFSSRIDPPMEFLKHSLLDLKIPFEIKKDKDGTFVFPKGVPELDNALVTEPYNWLADYPKTRDIYSRTIRQISNRENARDCADNLRKTFELFLQEFFDNKKNLDSNRTAIADYLKNHGINSETNQMIQALVNRYRLLNDTAVKHNDDIDDRSIEFLLYQTGIFIRLLLVLDENDKID